MTTVSVIIPAKDRVAFTSQAINSVLKQNLPQNTQVEVLVVDNGSTVPLKKILQNQFPQVNFLRYDGRQHPGATRNYGLRFAKGDFVAFLDNDDQWHPNFLKSSLEAIEKSAAPATVCLTSPYFYGPYPFDQKVKLFFLNAIRTLVLLFSSLFNNHSLPFSGFYLCQISHMLFSTRAIGKTRFNNFSVAAEDWEFVANISRLKQIYILSQPLVYFRYELRSNTNTPDVKQKKWNSYRDLIKHLPASHKLGLLYKLFLGYIKIYS